jgi:hypothetical protein
MFAAFGDDFIADNAKIFFENLLDSVEILRVEKGFLISNNEAVIPGDYVDRGDDFIADRTYKKAGNFSRCQDLRVCRKCDQPFGHFR